MGSNKILNGFQTFEEFPNGILEVNKNSNYFFIKIDGKKYIARQKYDYIEFDQTNKKTFLVYKISYYDVIDDKLIFKTTVFSDMKNVICERIKGNIDIEVEVLYKYLGLKDDKIFYLNFNQVEELVKEEKTKNKIK